MANYSRSAAPGSAVLFVLLSLAGAPAQAQDGPAAASSKGVPSPQTKSDEDPPPREVIVWGYAGGRAYAFGDQIAPNGLEFKALFRLEMDFNVWLWSSGGLYLFADTQFWGQRATPGITNPGQGAFDFSKREFDLNAGLAWNFAGPFEARAFAYSFNNRGDSTSRPTGYADGVGLENRYYLSDIYASLGTEAFDVSRATFLSVGYFPTKNMVDSRGEDFKPGPFARANLTLDLLSDKWYLFGDLTFIGTQSFTPKLLTLDAGLAFRPIAPVPRLEFRIGTSELFDLRNHDQETGLYGAVRINY